MININLSDHSLKLCLKMSSQYDCFLFGIEKGCHWQIERMTCGADTAPAKRQGELLRKASRFCGFYRGEGG